MRLFKYLAEEGETTASVGATTTDKVAKFERKLVLARRKKRKRRMFPKDDE